MSTDVKQAFFICFFKGGVLNGVVAGCFSGSGFDV